MKIHFGLPVLHFRQNNNYINLLPTWSSLIQQRKGRHNNASGQKLIVNVTEPSCTDRRNSALDFKRVKSNASFTKMSSTPKTVIACIQLCCTEDKAKNFDTCRNLILQAKEKGAKMVFLPEGFDYIGRTKEESLELSETVEGSLMHQYKKLAQELNVWLSLGGFHERQIEEVGSNSPKMTNDHILINPTGEIKSIYRKIHLFDVVIPEEKVFLKESSFIRAGNEILSPTETPIGNLGLGVCYDLRFPEFSLKLRQLGAHVLTYPSAFTVPTGQAHWETLLRARAIETQCFVVAAAQTGQHNAKRSSYGHSLIIDPWGKALADAGKDVGLITAEIDLDKVISVRQKMPVMHHRAPELYKVDCRESYTLPSDDRGLEEFSFGHVPVKYSFVFLESKLSRAFVNKKCVVPGRKHSFLKNWKLDVLVSSKRAVKRMCDLTPSEIADIFSLVQKVQIIMEGLHETSSSTVTVQDGKDAGQTIEHVHVHVLPRRKNDFSQNDEIYEKLASHDKGDKIVWRQECDMADECYKIRTYIKDHLAHLIL